MRDTLSNVLVIVAVSGVVIVYSLLFVGLAKALL